MQAVHLLISVFQHSAGASEEPQEHELGLLQARVAGNCVQYKLLHFLGIVWSLPKHMFQQQAVILNDLHMQQRISASAKSLASGQATVSF